MKDRLAERVREAYANKVSLFFERLKAMNLSDKELSAIPSLFIPGWGEDYDSSFFKVAIVGKETLSWGNEYGGSLQCDLIAHEQGKYDVLASCRRFREKGPSEWYNKFWQYPATALAKLFNSTRDDVLTKDNPLLRSIVWFNGHSIETYESKGVAQSDIAAEKMQEIQKVADECNLSDFETFVKVFQPHVIFYFYRNSSGIPNRTFPSDIELVQKWGNGIVDEYRMDGRTILLQFPHTTYFTCGNLGQADFANLVHEILKARHVQFALCEDGTKCDFYHMTAVEWMTWVEFVRNEAQKYLHEDNMALSRKLMAVIAKELTKRNATMNAQTLVLVLNEVDKFRMDNWQYSPERRGPCSSVRGAWNTYTNAGKKLEAKWIAEAFTKLDGSYAWE
ncbi:MAG: hypothetical protein IKH04_06120 [Kiritimatiellae bacterium]|nr:hypothetical protein [Kiritimatiellia bacterium]